jgi:hypothetical protein
MLSDRTFRQKLKKALIYASIALGVMFFTLLIYLFLIVSPKNLEEAKELGQYHEYHSSALPDGDGEIGYLNLENTYTQNSNDIYDNARASRPKIAILVTNLGLNHNSTELALSLPKEIALGFLPYTKKLKPLFKKARDLEHEVFIYVPFETEKYPMDFPGHLPILKNLTIDENIYRLNSHIADFPGILGIYASYKEAFLSDFSKSMPLISELNQKHLSLFFGKAAGNKEFTGERYIKTYDADIILDQEPNIASIKVNLDKLVALAKKNNQAIAYAESYPVTIYTLKAWVQNLDKLGIDLVPVSQITKNYTSNHESDSNQ